MNPVTPADPQERLTSHAAATIYLVSKSVDRSSEGRRIAASVVSRNEADSSMAVRGTHPDVIELAAPEGKERIGIGQVRDVIRSAQFAPVQSTCKVCLLPNAEELTVEAANALLKILEEPPRGLRFILLTEHPSDLLPTIVSRSRLIRIPIASQAQIIARLTAAGYEADHAQWIARLALRDGELDRLLASPANIPRLLGETMTELLQTDVSGVIDACLGEDPVLRRQGMLHLLRQMASREVELLTVGVRILSAQTRETLAQLFHDLLVVSFDLVRFAYSTSSLADAMADRVREVFDIRRLHEFCFALDEAHRSLAVYGPIEGVLLSLFLLSEGENHDS